MIINATCIGSRLTGLGRYSFSLSRRFLSGWDRPFRLYINEKAKIHFEDVKTDGRLRLASGALSPDFGFRGHLLRLMWTNILLRKSNEVVFNMSQLEASALGRQILAVHDLIPVLFPEFHKKQVPYFKYLLPAALRKSLKVITVSNDSKRLIMENFRVPESRIAVIYNGIDEKFSYVPGCKTEGYILFVGRLSPTKNPERLLKAYELLIKKYGVDAGLRITGKRQYFRKIPIGENIFNRIVFLENVSDGQLTDLYRKAALLVQPSLYEGFGLPPLEAMACGCPTVVSGAGGMREIYGDASLYVDPLDIESIAEGMYEVLTDEEKRKDLIKRGLSRSGQFGWDISAREHMKILGEYFD